MFTNQIEVTIRVVTSRHPRSQVAAPTMHTCSATITVLLLLLHVRDVLLVQ